MSGTVYHVDCFSRFKSDLVFKEVSGYERTHVGVFCRYLWEIYFRVPWCYFMKAVTPQSPLSK